MALDIKQAKGIFEVVTTYPTTTPAKAGQIFQYKGRLWHYMTQQEIDEVGWTGLVSVGFPAPVDKFHDFEVMYDGNVDVYVGFFSSINIAVFPRHNSIFNVLGAGKGALMVNKSFQITGLASVIGIRNAHFLISLEDVGTAAAVNISSCGFTAENLNDFFTQLTATTKTATLRVTGNPGAGTCDPSIATAKGYTVVV